MNFVIFSSELIIFYARENEEIGNKTNRLNFFMIFFVIILIFILTLSKT